MREGSLAVEDTWTDHHSWEGAVARGEAEVDTWTDHHSWEGAVTRGEAEVDTWTDHHNWEGAVSQNEEEESGLWKTLVQTTTVGKVLLAEV